MQAQVLSAPPCGPGYSISVNSVGACSYNLEANVPNPNDVSYVQWFISSTGQNGRLCDQIYGALQQPYDFCFYGNYAIKAIIIFLDGSKCEINLTTNITCINSLPCNPNPGSQIDHPKVLIAGIDAAGCNDGTHGLHFMFQPLTTICNIFTYKLGYIDVCEGVKCITLHPGQNCYIKIKENTHFTIKVTGDHCCLPSGYTRYLDGIANAYNAFWGGCHLYCIYQNPPCSNTPWAINLSSDPNNFTCLNFTGSHEDFAIDSKEIETDTYQETIKSIQVPFNDDSYIQIFDFLGKNIYSGSYHHDNFSLFEILKNIKIHGILLVKFYKGEELQTKKIIVQP